MNGGEESKRGRVENGLREKKKVKKKREREEKEKVAAVCILTGVSVTIVSTTKTSLISRPVLLMLLHYSCWDISMLCRVVHCTLAPHCVSQKVNSASTKVAMYARAGRALNLSTSHDVQWSH